MRPALLFAALGRLAVPPRVASLAAGGHPLTMVGTVVAAWPPAPYRAFRSSQDGMRTGRPGAVCCTRHVTTRLGLPSGTTPEPGRRITGAGTHRLIRLRAKCLLQAPGSSARLTHAEALTRGPHSGRRDRAEPLARPTRGNASQGNASQGGADLRTDVTLYACPRPFAAAFLCPRTLT